MARTSRDSPYTPVMGRIKGELVTKLDVCTDLLGLTLDEKLIPDSSSSGGGGGAAATAGATWGSYVKNG
jgi:hypothetical protein